MNTQTENGSSTTAPPILENPLLTALSRTDAPVSALDPEARVSTWNEAAERILGVSADAARGRPLAEVLGTSGRELGKLITGPHRSVEVRASTPSGTFRLALIPVVLDAPSANAPLAVVMHACEAEVARPDTDEVGVTPRELEVLRLLARGESTVAIAGQLGIARTTARNHIQALLGKLGAHSRLEAVAKARDMKLVQ
jgi:DNA-binding CsgD family transcriptional regulator